MERPESSIELAKLLPKHMKLEPLDQDYEENENVTDRDYPEEIDEENDEDEEEGGSNAEEDEATFNDYIDEESTPDDKFKNDTIKNNSPFNSFFKNIRDKTQANVTAIDEDSNNKKNIFYCKKYFDHLENKFMPYFFIWGAIVLKGSGMTRITNGVLEVYQGFMKKRLTKMCYHIDI